MSSLKSISLKARAVASIVAMGMSMIAFEARAELVDIDWDEGGQFERDLGVPPGKFVEVCGKLIRGQSITWAFDADVPLNFNVHYHQGAQVVYPAKQDAATKTRGALDVALDQDYCWMWNNKSDRAGQLRLLLKKQ